MTAGRGLDRPIPAWAAGLAPLLAVDVALIRTGRRSLSCHAHAHRAWRYGLLGYLAIHFARPTWFEPIDPLGVIVRRLTAGARPGDSAGIAP